MDAKYIEQGKFDYPNKHLKIFTIFLKSRAYILEHFCLWPV